MQTILVPIDFTAASDNALVYANKLALRLPADLVLVHGGVGTTADTARQDAVLRRLEALAERLRYQQLTRQSGRRINYHFHVTTDSLADSLEVLVAGYQASFVVTGLSLRDCASEQLAGQPPVLLPERVSCPVLVVPPGRHELPSRVAVAGSFARLSASHLRLLPQLGRTPGTQFHLVQFYAPAAGGLLPLKQALRQAHAQLPNAEQHLLPEEDLLEDISEFCAQRDVQLLVLGTSDGCLPRRIFSPSYLRTNAYHLRIPVLLLPTSTLPTAACCAQCALRRAASLPQGAGWSGFMPMALAPRAAYAR